jgi:hypothetical protein
LAAQLTRYQLYSPLQLPEPDQILGRFTKIDLVFCKHLKEKQTNYKQGLKYPTMESDVCVPDPLEQGNKNNSPTRHQQEVQGEKQPISKFPRD